MFVIYIYDLADDLTTDPLLCAGELELIAPRKQTVPWPLVPNGPRAWSYLSTLPKAFNPFTNALEFCTSTGTKPLQTINTVRALVMNTGFSADDDVASATKKGPGLFF